jgi:hypothetical protein
MNRKTMNVEWIKLTVKFGNAHTPVKGNMSLSFKASAYKEMVTLLISYHLATAHQRNRRADGWPDTYS